MEGLEGYRYRSHVLYEDELPWYEDRAAPYVAPVCEYVAPECRYQAECIYIILILSPPYNFKI